jgi:hypothetical protein
MLAQQQNASVRRTPYTPYTPYTLTVLAEQHNAALAVNAHLRVAEEQRQRGVVTEAHVLDLHRCGARAELAARLEAERRLRVLLQAQRVAGHLLRLELELLRLLLLGLEHLHRLGRRAQLADVEAAQLLDHLGLVLHLALVRQLLLLPPLGPGRVVAAALHELARGAWVSIRALRVEAV